MVAQQLSTASASAILERLKAALDPLDHEAVRRARPAKLARIGLSAPKIRTLKAIARAVSEGAIDLPSLVDMSAEDAHRALTALHGIGPWTADIYLLFCLGHADAWPAGDLALQEAARLLLGRRHARPPRTWARSPKPAPWRARRPARLGSLSVVKTGCAPHQEKSRRPRNRKNRLQRKHAETPYWRTGGPADAAGGNGAPLVVCSRRQALTQRPD